MPTNEPMPKLHELEDVQVLRMGLVTHGANREDFFLRKEADMPEENVLQLEQAASTDVPPSWVAKLRDWIRGDIAEELEKKAPVDPKAQEAMHRACKILQSADNLPPEAKKALAKLKELAGDNEEGYGYPEPAKKAAKPADAEDESEGPEDKKPDAEDAAEGAEEGYPVPGDKKKMKKSEPEAEVAKSEAEPVVSVPPEIIQQLAALQKSQEDLVAELQKSRDAEFRMTYVSKAESLTAAPVESEALAEQLMFIAKADPARADWWYNLLTAVDHQLADAGFWNERGTVSPAERSQIADLEKSGKPLREAVLTLNPAEAQAYLAERRYAARTGR